MEQRKKIDLMNFPGKTHLFVEEQCLNYYQFTLSEPVDRDILEDAVNEVAERAEYFRTRFVWGEDSLYAISTEQHCTVYGKSDTPKLSDEGYLFYVQAFDDVVIFCWDHILADGNGFTPFAMEVLESYLSKKDGLTHVKRNLRSLQEYDVVFPVCKYKGESSHHQAPQVRDLADESRCVISLNRADWVRASTRRGVRPFALLVAIFYEAHRRCCGNGPKSFAFPVDMRSLLGLNGIPCSCMTYVDLYYEDSPEQSFEDVIRQVGKLVEDSMEKDHVLGTYLNNHQWMRDILSTSKKMSIKRRILQMGSELQQTNDFWVSYLGDFLRDTEPWLGDHVRNVGIWLSYAKAPLFAECLTLNGKLSLCISSRLGNQDVFPVIKDLIKSLEIEII